MNFKDSFKEMNYAANYREAFRDLIDFKQRANRYIFDSNRPLLNIFTNSYLQFNEKYVDEGDTVLRSVKEVVISQNIENQFFSKSHMEFENRMRVNLLDIEKQVRESDSDSEIFDDGGAVMGNYNKWLYKITSDKREIGHDVVGKIWDFNVSLRNNFDYKGLVNFESNNIEYRFNIANFWFEKKKFFLMGKDKWVLKGVFQKVEDRVEWFEKSTELFNAMSYHALICRGGLVK